MCFFYGKEMYQARCGTQLPAMILLSEQNPLAIHKCKLQQESHKGNIFNQADHDLAPFCQLGFKLAKFHIGESIALM